MNCHEIQELVPAYVLDAVEPSERTEIEAHLPKCANCRSVVAEFQPVVDLLPYAAEQVEPPPALKYRVLAATLPARKEVVAPAPAPRRSWSDLLASLFRSPALAAAALFLVVGLTLWNVNLQNQMSSELARQRELMTMMAYADGQPRHLQGTEVAAHAVGRLYGGYDENTFAVVTYDLPALASGKVYQLWLIDAGGTRTSGGLFTVDELGRGWLMGHSPMPLNQYKSVGVTVEPWGGSPGPTGAKMLGGNL